ncbi:TspO/MBR family protein [Kitasatospora purpeofusca]|uniref:TspO/MBR family protein n=1 Tax=Kitasatospora purpeofusca TaxID=67352 RepID=UPI0022564C87|nr:TspO/MBR family protein [Kitasatospora purpeofusca]MCX4757218.1 tryptophan-rich sensory protein [Kitasatospora purpeofusca]WSR35027.1 tryptophan-rich sensory protein [Kitasatospora purpeofusca]
MRIISERSRPSAPARWPVYAATAAAVTATAVVGGKAVDADSDWYRSLAKPPWQPPSWAFGAVWTPLYASIAWAGGRALLKAHGHERRALTAGLGVNLGLNAAWNWMFFRCHSPAAGVAGTLLLDLSNADLIRRTARTDRTAATALLPYAAWCAFATALNAEIARRNPGR